MKFENRYGRADRFLHEIAFRAGQAQQALADLEELLYQETLQGIALTEPVFITALPRSGTTILLQILTKTGKFASHIYRDMPFVLCPMLWSRFSERFGVDLPETERAHGDGLTISGGTPEAFEEMVWKRFWPEHYHSDRILPWTIGDQNREFDDFLEKHMRKIIALRSEDDSAHLRYISKNNLNISRLAAPPEPLRRGTFLIPFREPLQHAASMLRQHQRFLKIHRDDGFVRRYMAAIGHHEFGECLRPVDFGGWLDEPGNPDRLEFWVCYWNAAYRHVLEHAGPSTVLVSYARLTEDSEAALRRLGSILGLGEDALASEADTLHPPRSHPVDSTEISGSTLADAMSLHDNLKSAAAV